MSDEEFEEELWRENLYYVYEDKCELLEKDVERLTKVNQEHQRLNGELRKEIEFLQNDLDSTNSQLANVSKRCIKAIEYIENYINQFNGVYPIADMRYLDLHKLLDILKGSDKE